MDDQTRERSSDYRTILFEEYHVRTAMLDPDEAAKLAWFNNYVRTNYLPHLALPRDGEILDVGCNRGYMLAALAAAGFRRIAGVDLSEHDVDVARRIAPTADLTCADAGEYLAAHAGRYDAIIAKAILEHVPKSEVLSFMSAIKSGLRPGGIALFDVPNMDWLFASHERYLDFTHEVGFTKEALQQVAGSVFSEVKLFPVDNTPPKGRLSRRAIARSLVSLVLRWADPEGASNPVWCRSLIAVGRG